MGSMHSGLEKGSVMGGSVDLSSMGEFFAERARGGVGLIVTGGVAPNRAGWVSPFAAKLSNDAEMEVRRGRGTCFCVQLEKLTQRATLP